MYSMQTKHSMSSYGSRRCKTTLPASDEVNDSVIRSEVMHTNFNVQHSLSFLIADHHAPVCSQMFSDLKIVQKLSCAWTKTTAILNNVICPALHGSLVTYMQNSPFSICNDEPCMR